MALLGHVSAEMSLRYGRLFDATVRDEYERALDLAKAQLGPVLPAERTRLPLAAITGGNWQDAPLIKSRLAGGYCLRTAAQGPAPTPTSASTARTSAPRPASCRCCSCSAPTPKRSPPTPTPAAGATRQPGTAASSNDSTCSSRRPRPADHDQLDPASRPPAPQLAAAGQPVTFRAVAARAGIGRATLYRRPDLRAVVEEHRTRGQDAAP